MQEGVVDEGILLKDYISLIQNSASFALSKIKHPPTCDLDDLCQEGLCVFLNARDKYKKDGIATFRTFLTTCLRNHFDGLVKKSYKSIDRRTGYESSFFANICFINNPDTLVTILSHHEEAFNSREIRYIRFLLNIPSKAQEEIRHRVGRCRVVIRKELQLSPYVETKIRRSIKRKLTSCNF